MKSPATPFRSLWSCVLVCIAFSFTQVAYAQEEAASPPGDAKNKATQALEAAREGALARRNGDIVEACGAFERAVRLTPTWAVAQMELGRCYRLLGDPKSAAREHLELALKWLPNWSLIHIELGRIAEDQRRPKAAGEFYVKAEKLAAADIRAAGGAARLGPSSTGTARLVRLRRILNRQPGNLALLGELATQAEAVFALDESERALRTILEHSRHPRRAAARLVRFGNRTNRKDAIKAGMAILKKKRSTTGSRRK